jgi:hypothetical protein
LFTGISVAMKKIVQNFYCKSIGYKSVCKNTSLFVWQIAITSPTFATRSKKRDFSKNSTGWRGKNKI